MSLHRFFYLGEMARANAKNRGWKDLCSGHFNGDGTHLSKIDSTSFLLSPEHVLPWDRCPAPKHATLRSKVAVPVDFR